MSRTAHLGAMSWLMSINPWLTLVVAGLLEVLWASGLKNVGPSRPLTSLGVLVALAGSMVLLWVATQRLPIGTAYAIWTGIGAVGAFVVGAVFLGEPLTPLRIAGVALVASGLVVLKLAASH